MNIKKFEDKFKLEKDYLKKLNIAKEIIELFNDNSVEELISPYYEFIIKNAHYPNWESIRAYALFREGTLLYNKSKFQKALEYLIESAAIFHEFKDFSYYTKVMNNLAIVYTATNKEDKAIKIYKDILKHAHQDLNILINYANLLIGRGDAETALNLLYEAYKVAQQANSKQMLFVVMVELSNYYNNQNEPEKSIDLLFPMINNVTNITERTRVFAYLIVAEFEISSKRKSTPVIVSPVSIIISSELLV